MLDNREGHMQEIIGLSEEGLGLLIDKLIVYPCVVEDKIREAELQAYGAKVPVFVMLKKEFLIDKYSQIMTCFSEEQNNLLKIANSHYLIIPVTDMVHGSSSIAKALILTNEFQAQFIYDFGKQGGYTPWANTTIFSVYVNGKDILDGAVITARITDAGTKVADTVKNTLDALLNTVCLSLAS